MCKIWMVNLHIMIEIYSVETSCKFLDSRANKDITQLLAYYSRHANVYIDR